MLSNQFPELRSTHKRQNSSPNISLVAPIAQQFQEAYNRPTNQHRRGLSLDRTMHKQEPTNQLSSTNGTVSIDPRLYGQQQMREPHGLPGPGPGTDFAIMDSRKMALDARYSPFGPDSAFVNSVPMEVIQESTHFGEGDGDYSPLNAFCSMYNSSSGSRTAQSSPARRSPNKGPPLALYMKRGSSCQESSSMERQHSGLSSVPSPPNTAPLRCSATFDIAPLPSPNFLDLSALNADFPIYSPDCDPSNYSPMTSRTSPACSSFQSSPELGPVSLFGHHSDIAPQFLPPIEEPQTPRRRSPAKSQQSSPRKKAQMPSSMMLTETGITTEDVDAFVQGPDDSGKYVCLYDGCTMKAFGRKENIRAHVQTHLGDRKYVCGICANRFVRPNDLKRHSLIHQDDKDCICNCGAKFGRPDALRRHRTRKLECAAGDPTILALMKEEKKRGRPKKKAPVESAERRERKEKTRRKVMEKKRANSVATSTASSYPSPQHESSPLPQEWMPAGDMSFTPPASPEDSSQNIFSPYEFQPSPFVKGTSLSPPPTRGSMTAPDAKEIMVLASISPAEIDPFGPCDESLPPNSPLKSSLSEYGTPPELDLSSSPTSRLLDFGSTDSDLSSQATSTDKLMISSPPNDFDEFFAVDKFTSGRIVDLNDPFGDSMDWNQYNFR